MKGFIFYRIACYFLLFIAGFFAMSLVVYLPVAFTNPVLLLSCFLLACVILYSYTSYRFMSKGMILQQPLKKSLKDLLRVNAYGSLVLGILLLSNSLVFLQSPEMLEEQIDAMNASSAMEIDPDIIISFMKKMFIFLTIYSIILILHVFVSLRLIKRYSYLFDDQA